ncbi:hypothetical protein E2P84_43740 [Burkholderia cepacia]|uniref:Type II/III secretion system secretin-like domain-containing protein n=1 Tax=Burkholderia cepacia TaxID=292 RepID=A0AAX2RRK4_BURCE|nr:hypothetical protein [Burkholderia cepacia]TES61329.1 hypothetical protein E2P84_43740 [Burkholderia cepacia]TET01713.1 hypothetical protein E3D36_16900 [Burkholderia cepacia]TEU47571.1 hypothetical protein E3D37_16330 [Burkholderia cepacia]TEU53443.1 hypothetical protein E3D38_11915 [Burkholderia cepacia]TEV02204.1 hypothetical protein E3D40_13650 [Burkholderia cepacia]
MRLDRYLVAVAAAPLLTACISPELLDATKKPTESALAAVDAREQLLARLSSSRNAAPRSQDVNKPYLAGKVRPLPRNVSLPYALRKGVSVAVIFPEKRVKWATFAERVELATGIPVVVAPEVYLPLSAMMPLSQGGPGGAPNGNSIATQLPMPTPSGLGVDAKAIPGVNPPGTPLGSVIPRPGYANAASDDDDYLTVDVDNTIEPVANLLDRAASRKTVHWEYDEKTNVLRIYRFVTRQWQIPVSGAQRTYSSNFTGGTQQSSSQTSLQSNNDTSPMKSEVKDANELYSIRDTAKLVMTQAGKIYADPNSGTITISDTKEAVDAAEKLVRKQVAILSRTVLLRLQTVQLTSNDDGESGVDWNAVISRALHSLPQFSLSTLSPATLVGSNAGSVGLNIVSGAAGGSKAIIQALKEIGHVETSTELPLATRNRHPVYYNVRQSFNYVQSTTPATGAVGGSGGVPGIITAQDQVGTKIFLFPNATSKDNVMLTVSLDSSVKQSMDTFTSGNGSNQQSVQLPVINGEGSQQEVPIRNGSTIVLTGFDRKQNQFEQRTLGDKIPLLAGGSRTASSTRTTTIVLVSVQIVDSNEGDSL